MFRPGSGSTARKNSFARRRGTPRSVVFHLPLALALLTVALAEHVRAPTLLGAARLAESREPRAESREPRAESREPGAGSRRGPQVT
jgi:hypothetical protein